MRRGSVLLVAAVWVLAAVSSVLAYPEQVEEVWRSRFGVTPQGRGGYISFDSPLDVMVTNPTDGSVWTIEGGMVTHCDATGALVGRSPGLPAPQYLALDRADGSCWVLQLTAGLVHLAPDGHVLSTTAPPWYFTSVTPSPFDGSAWVVGVPPDAPYSSFVAHVSAAGDVLSTTDFPDIPSSAIWVVVDPNDGAVWEVTVDEIIRLNADGSEAWRVANPRGLPAEDTRDHSLWLGQNVHLSAAGDIIWQGTTSLRTMANVWVSPVDGSVWASYYTPAPPPGDPYPVYTPPEVIHITSAGVVANSYPGTLRGANADDGSVWVDVHDDVLGRQFVEYGSDGQEVRRFAPPGSSLTAVVYSPYDHSSWALAAPAPGTYQRLHISQDGTVLETTAAPRLSLAGRTADPEDGSVWALEGQQFVRFSPEGAELERRDPPATVVTNGYHLYASGLLISPFDGSWWLSVNDAEGYGYVLLHLTPDGTELGQAQGSHGVPTVDPRDGSLWETYSAYTTYEENGVVHYVWTSALRHHAADGAFLWTRDYASALSQPFLEADGSAWLFVFYDSGPVREHFSAAGELLGTLPVTDALLETYVCAQSPSDGSLYGVYASNDPLDGFRSGTVRRFTRDGELLWEQPGFSNSALLVTSADNSVWVADPGNGPWDWPPASVTHVAADGSILWKSEGFTFPCWIDLSEQGDSLWIADGSDQIVHLAVVPPIFTDIPYDFWARDAIKECLDAGLVQGYKDGSYGPTNAVTRAQLAVFIARGLCGGDENVPTSAAQTFPDVDASFWAHDHIEYCAANDIVHGFKDGYWPFATVTRAQMAVFMAKAMGLLGQPDPEAYTPPATPSFPDVDSGFWAYRYIEYCHEYAGIQGFQDGYHAERAVTRAQMAVYLANAFGLAPQ